MRGKVSLSLLFHLRQRITPAHAGKSPVESPAWVNGKDHPRACGEKVARGKEAVFVEGSPPRMRGKESEFAESCDNMRITPAHAGKRAIIDTVMLSE